MRIPAALLILSASFAGCGGGAPGGNEASPAAGGVRVPLLRQDGDADAALTEGFLHVEGPCLYILDNRGAGERIMPAFTVAVSWDARENVLVAGESRIRPGEQVWLSGSRARNPRALAWVQPPHPSCDAANVYVSNNVSPIGAIAAQKQERAAGSR
jgi:hypothetical protein